MHISWEKFEENSSISIGYKYLEPTWQNKENHV